MRREEEEEEENKEKANEEALGGLRESVLCLSERVERVVAEMRMRQEENWVRLLNIFLPMYLLAIPYLLPSIPYLLPHCLLFNFGVIVLRVLRRLE